MRDRMSTSMALKSCRILSRQGLRLECPARGQLHRLATGEDLFGVFAYVIAVENGMCNVMLGSTDGMMASACDFVLPPSVLGDHVMLSPETRSAVPVASLGMGFAVLDERVCDRIDQALGRADEGFNEIGFVRGYPFVSMCDDRIAYRIKMSLALKSMVEGRPSSSDSNAEDWSVVPLAAAGTATPFSADFRVDGLEGLVHIHHVPADRQFMLCVFDPDGNRSDSLDGWGVFGKDAELLGTIEGTSFICEVKDGFNGVIVLVDETGKVHTLWNNVESR